MFVPGEAGKLFSARYLDEDETKQHKEQIFSHVDFCKGNCFHKGSGTFKAPFDGAYVFSARIESKEKGVQVCSYIMIDTISHTPIRCGYEGKSVCVFVQLTSGQTVWMKADSTVNKYHFPNITFSGTLIQIA